MNKRKLPKAIIRPAGEMRHEFAGHAVESRQESLPAMETGPSTDDGAAAPRLNGKSDAVGAVPAATAPAGRAPALRRRPRDEVNAVRRLTQAQSIVERHATYAAAGGLIPLPIVNVGSVMAIILRMVKMLSRLYGVPFERDRARAVVVGLAGGAVPTGLAAVATSTFQYVASSALQYLVPASALLGLAVSSVTASACTRSIGRIFIAHFEGGETLDDFPTLGRR
jgi:uncharacterized protein (DUF697 family)